ncbi:epidermal growth factor-like protein 7 isoform X2 [Brachyhypopomus gauderio]|uniref:epidermal growth factor-like protein 7 isoform X2 n=1 Tax=Brachyhypopomus gauderio TaxID=698409 RepID=UPI0040417BA7
MYFEVLLSTFLFSLPTSVSPQSYSHHGRRVCVGSTGNSRVISTTESFIQPVHKPYITMCPDLRLCSTYKTVYTVSYRQVSRAGPSFYQQCCPGWQRLHSHHCNHAVCTQECVNGGSCVRPNNCACTIGWTGRYCQIDVDECNGAHGCAQSCVNTAGSYQCECAGGFRLAEDGRSCLRLLPPPPPSSHSSQPAPSNRSPIRRQRCGGAGLVENVTEEVQILKNRVELLEQKLEMVLAPFSTLLPLEEGVADRNSFLFDKTNFLSDQTNFLSHSLRQLDRIDSLSEQVGFLEERLGSCSCQEN